MQQKPGRQEREYHSYPDMRDCVTGSNNSSLLYLVACGTLQLPMGLSKRKCKTPIQEQARNLAIKPVIALETEDGNSAPSDQVVKRMNVIEHKNEVNGPSVMIAPRTNIIQHENIYELNIAVQPETERFADAIAAVDASGSNVLVTGILR